MRIPSLAFLVATVVYGSTPSVAGSISLLAGRIACDLSDKLVAVPTEELSRLSLKPLAAYVTTGRDARITVTNGKHLHPITEMDLPEVKAAMESGFTKMFPGATWNARELLRLNGKSWIHFDFTGQVNGTAMRSELYVTDFSGNQLQFLFQSSGARPKEVEDAFNACVRTLRVTE